MAKVTPEAAEVNARILYWGIEGAGKRTSLRGVYTKLRPDHRGKVSEVPTRLDPSVVYTVLPIELGDIGSMRTRIELIAVPGGPEQAPTRKSLLDQVDGVVLVIDSDPARAEENTAIVDELRKGLAEYARRLDDMPLVVQYNKRDLTDDYGIDELHRRLGLGGATVFESVATDGRGLLQTLSTISKKVIRALRGESIGPPLSPAPAPPAPVATPPRAAAAAPAAPAPAPSRPPLARPQASPAAARPAVPSPPAARAFENAILEEDARDDARALDAEVSSAQSLLDAPWPGGPDVIETQGARLGPELSIVSVGDAVRVDAHSLRVPVVLGDREGQTSTLMLTIRLDALVDGDGGG
jgi:signal recognition particle receptor subunit beta